MSCEKKSIDSNVVGLSFAEESCIGVLPDQTPDSGDELGGVWYPLEPNEYDDFGGELSTIVRTPINSSRQRKKGPITDLESSGGFSQDLTQNNLSRLLQGFVFADMREGANTHPYKQGGTNTVTLQDFAVGNDITVDTGEGAKYAVGMILKISNTANAANSHNEAVIASIAGDVLTTDKTFVVETADGSQKMEIVGFEGVTTDLSLSVSGSDVSLISAASAFADLTISQGQWIYIGGDAAGSKFSDVLQGYARVISVTDSTLMLDECSFVPVTDAGTGKNIRLYFTSFLRNEKDPVLVKRRSYQLERTLGNDENGVQSEYITGAVANEFTLNIAPADKITCDLSFVGLDNVTRDGTTGIKPGVRNTLVSEDAFNTSSDVKQMRLYVHDDNAITPVSLFAYVLEASIAINNNATGRKAIGTLGSIEITNGDFEVSGELEVYFATVAAINAVRNNKDVGFNIVVGADNAGMVYDIPLLGLSGGRVTVEKDEPILIPLEKNAAENKWGYTLGVSYFSYLPTVALN